VFSTEKHEFSAGCRKGQADGLQSKADRRAAEKGGPTFSAHPNVQSAGPPKMLVFQLETRPSSPPGPPFSVIPRDIPEGVQSEYDETEPDCLTRVLPVARMI